MKSPRSRIERFGYAGGALGAGVTALGVDMYDNNMHPFFDFLTKNQDGTSIPLENAHASGAIFSFLGLALMLASVLLIHSARKFPR
jgi:hypothetical protein